MNTVLVADSNDALRAGVKAILDCSGKYRVVGEARNRTQLIQKIKNFPVDILLLEPKIGGATGETLIRQVSAIAPSTIMLGLSDLDEKKFGPRVVRAGLRGFVRKNCEKEELLSAIDHVSSGHLHLSVLLAESLVSSLTHVEQAPPHQRLSERELDVFHRLMQGEKVGRIAEKLQLSPKTISTHKLRVYQKLGVTTLSELVQYALVHGMT